MSVNVQWMNDNTQDTVCYEFVGLWTWYEFARASTQAFQMMSEVSYPVGVVFDMDASLDMPTGSLKAMRHYMRFAPENLDVIVLVNADYVTKASFNLLMQLDNCFRRRITAIDDPHEACSFIQDRMMAALA